MSALRVLLLLPAPSPPQLLLGLVHRPTVLRTLLLARLRIGRHIFPFVFGRGVQRSKLRKQYLAVRLAATVRSYFEYNKTRTPSSLFRARRKDAWSGRCGMDKLDQTDLTVAPRWPLPGRILHENISNLRVSYLSMYSVFPCSALPCPACPAIVVYLSGG